MSLIACKGMDSCKFTGDRVVSRPTSVIVLIDCLEGLISKSTYYVSSGTRSADSTGGGRDIRRSNCQGTGARV